MLCHTGVQNESSPTLMWMLYHLIVHNERVSIDIAVMVCHTRVTNKKSNFWCGCYVIMKKLHIK